MIMGIISNTASTNDLMTIIPKEGEGRKKKKNKKAPIPGNAGPNPKHPINLGFDAWNLGRGGR